MKNGKRFAIIVIIYEILIGSGNFEFQTNFPRQLSVLCHYLMGRFSGKILAAASFLMMFLQFTVYGVTDHVLPAFIAMLLLKAVSSQLFCYDHAKGGAGDRP